MRWGLFQGGFKALKTLRSALGVHHSWILFLKRGQTVAMKISLRGPDIRSGEDMRIPQS